jgi:two-component system, LytTR family, sensor kinase
MNAISMLVRANKNERAVAVISDLSNLLRHSLKEEKRNLIPLKEEMEITRKYLALEEKLYIDSLEVSISINEETEKFLVPHLILQPIIENAFMHGFSKTTSKGTLKISAFLISRSVLCVQVQNAGPYLASDWSLEKNRGIGISNVISRLENLYASDFQFKLENDPNGGVVTTICIPTNK